MKINPITCFWAGVIAFALWKPYLFRAPRYKWEHKDIAEKINKQVIISDQYHSCDVVIIDEGNRDIIPQSDAMITHLEDVALFVIASDCVPILLFNSESKAIWAIHAGRRGLEGGIIKNTLKLFPWNISQVQAYIWPCISKKNYELWHMEIKNFQDAYPDCIDISNASAWKYLLDIWAIAYRQLTEYGVLWKNITVSWECTYENADIYHSYRRNTHCPEENYWNNAFGIWKS